jgi:hypothetical protein
MKAFLWCATLLACVGALAADIEPRLIPQAVADGVDLANPAHVRAWIARYDANQTAKQADPIKRNSLRKFRAAWLALGQTWPPQPADMAKVRAQIRVAAKAKQDSAAAKIAATNWRGALEDILAAQVLLMDGVDLLSAWVELGPLIHTPDVPAD